MNKEKRLLEYLTNNNGITSLEAINKLGDTRLSATIFNLRKAGHNISTVWETNLNRFGEERRFKRYFLIGG